MKNDITPLLLSVYPELESVPAAVLQPVIDCTSLVHLRSGSSIFREGDLCNRYILVLEGIIKVQKISEDGHEITLYRVESGQCCELTTTCLLGGHHYHAEAITETEEAIIVTIPKTAFLTAVAKSDTFRDFVFSSLDEGISELVTLVETIAFDPMEQRIANLLMLLLGDEKRDSIITTHQQIATELGTAREVVSRVLKKFEKDGMLELHRCRINILDKPRLCKIIAREPYQKRHAS